MRTPDIRTIYEERAKGYRHLMVYGPSQVGKTELILRLLGVDLGAPDLGRVKNALRGQQGEFRPATATATIWQRGETDRFILRAGGRPPRELDTDSLGAELSALRAAVEAGDEGGGLVEIALPTWLLGAPLSTDLHIIDLPGAESTEAKEWAHVETLMKRYLPLASAVILVLNATKGLAQLDALQLKDSGDWRDDHARFRVVLTQAISPKSVQRIVFKDDFSAEVLTSYYAERARKTVRRMPDNLKLYPVEFGSSWADRAKDNPSLHARATPIVDDVLCSLVDGLPEPGPATALRAMAHLYLLGRRVAIERARRFREQLSTLRNRVPGAQSRMATLGELVEYDRGEAGIAARRAESLASWAPPPCWVTDPTIAVGDVDAEVLQSALDDAALALLSWKNAAFVDAEEHGITRQVDEVDVDTICAREFSELRGRAKGWYVFPAAKRRDAEAAAASVYSARKSVVQDVGTKLASARDSAVAAVREQADEAMARVAAHVREQTLLAEEMRETSMNCAEMRMRHAEWVTMAVADLSEGRRFFGHLRRALDEDCAQAREALDEAQDGFARLRIGLRILAMTDAARTVLPELKPDVR